MHAATLLPSLSSSLRSRGGACRCPFAELHAAFCSGRGVVLPVHSADTAHCKLSGRFGGVATALLHIACLPLWLVVALTTAMWRRRSYDIEKDWSCAASPWSRDVIGVPLCAQAIMVEKKDASKGAGAGAGGMPGGFGPGGMPAGMTM